MIETISIAVFALVGVIGLAWLAIGEKQAMRDIEALEEMGWDASMLYSLAGRARALAMLQGGQWPLPRKR